MQVKFLEQDVTNKSSVPFVNDLCECCRARGHKYLPNTILKHLHVFIIYTQEGNSRAFLSLLVLQIPDSVSCIAECLLGHSNLRQYPNFKPTPKQAYQHKLIQRK